MAPARDILKELNVPDPEPSVTYYTNNEHILGFLIASRLAEYESMPHYVKLKPGHFDSVENRFIGVTFTSLPPKALVYKFDNAEALFYAEPSVSW